MNIYDFAMQMEVDGENYYRDLAHKSSSAGLKKIFTMLADEEVKHYKIVEMLKKLTYSGDFVDTDILDNVKNVFVDMKETEPDIHIDTTEETQIYRKARNIEEASRDFYTEQGEKAENRKQREIFQLLAREEAKHLRIMNNIVEFVSRPEPGQWLENAEWHHLDAY